MTLPRGYVLYQGPSMLDMSTDIVAVLTMSTENKKTLLPTVWIMPTGMSPQEAVNTGADVSVCGDCRHRSVASGGQGSCYVIPWRDPGMVYGGWTRNIYPDWRTDNSWQWRLRGVVVRIGGWGEPTAVPLSVWRKLARMSRRTLGYTHQWPNIGREWAEMFMASVDSQAEADMAEVLGYRPFRVTPIGDTSRRPGEVPCPASEERGFKTTCNVCLACDGNASGRRQGIRIEAHGATAKRVLAETDISVSAVSAGF